MIRRSRARGWALQVLYAWETRDPGASPHAILEQFAAERRISPRNAEYVGTLIAAVVTHRDAIDDGLQEALLNWRLERLSRIDRCILRMAAAEMLFLEVPPRVVIQEAIQLAEKYGSHDSPRFVNGVLDALMRHAGALDGARRSDSL